MSLEAVLLAAGLAAVFVAVVWFGLASKRELRELRAMLARRETAEVGSDAAAARANPRLAAAREAAASRVAKRPGRTSIKRI